MNGYLLIDGNSIGHAANNMAPLTVGETPVQAIYGYLRTLRALVAAHGTLHPVVLWDGVSWRNFVFPEYKENRKKADTANDKKILEAKNTFKKQVPAIKALTKALGVDQMFSMNMEADDLAAILADRYSARGSHVMLVTADRDWLQLVGPRVTWFDPIGNRKGEKITEKDLVEKIGLPNVRQFVEMKALMGDQGDNVPGVGGIGEKGAIEFLATYGSFKDFMNQCILEKTIDYTKLPKKFRNLVDDESKAITFDRNMELVDLRSPKRPEPANLTLTRGQPDATLFEGMCRKLMFYSITKNLDTWLPAFAAFKTERIPA